MKQQIQTKWHLKIIFVYYASYADRNNYKHLKQQNYRRFLIDSETVCAQCNFASLDIIFRKVNSSSLSHEQFLELLPKLATAIYKQTNRHTAFKNYLYKHLEPLYNEIISSSDYGKDIATVMQNQVQEQIQQILMNSTAIKQAYEQYIVLTSMHQKQANDTFEQLCYFLKDFQVSPQLIYKSMCYIIFINVVQVDKFTLESFVNIIISIAELVITKQLSNSTCQMAKVILLLEKMEVSIGLNKLNLKSKIQNSHSISFLRNIFDLSKKESDQCLPRFQEYFKQFPSNQITQQSTQDVFRSANKGTRKLNQVYLSEKVRRECQSSKINLKQLKNFYEKMCSFGEVANEKTLKSIKIKKLYKKLGLISSVSQVWLDLQITNLSRSSISGKIQFIQFISLLNRTANKLGVSSDKIHELMICSGKLDECNDYSKFDDNLKDMVQQIEKPLLKIINHYSNSSNKVLNFQQISKFAYNFDIFPSFITKNKLYQIFVECSNIHFDEQEVLSNISKERVLTLEGLKQFLIGISHQIHDISLTSQQKFIIMIQKMYDSKGNHQLFNTGISLVAQLRINYSDLYVANFEQSESKLAEDEKFEDLLSSIQIY